MPSEIRLISRLFLLQVALLVSTLSPSVAGAMDVAIALSQPDGPHRVFREVVRSGEVNLAHTIHDAGDAETGLDQHALERADLIVAVGAKVTQQILAKAKRPVLSVLISRAQYENLRQSFPKGPYSAIVLDHPPVRHMRLASIVAPNITRVGLLVSPDSEAVENGFRSAALDAGVKLNTRTVNSSDELLLHLEQLLQANDALLMIPDPVVASQGAARTILLTSYRYRRPILAYSQAYVHAGALASVYSSPEDVARDVLEWLRTKGDQGIIDGTEIPPQRFSVAVNRQVARSLGLDVPPDDVLIRHVAGKGAK